MRSFISKSIAGGLSAGVVLLWWPMLFPGDSVASWLIRGVAWTLCFEMLVTALAPLEGLVVEKARRLGPARTAGPSLGVGRRTMVAVLALAVPLSLLAAGLAERPRSSKPAPRAVKVVRVTKVVRPVTVERVVHGPAGAAPTRDSSADPPRLDRGATKQPKRKPQSSAPDAAPRKRVRRPAVVPEQAPPPVEPRSRTPVCSDGACDAPREAPVAGDSSA